MKNVEVPVRQKTREDDLTIRQESSTGSSAPRKQKQTRRTQGREQTIKGTLQQAIEEDQKENYDFYNQDDGIANIELNSLEQADPQREQQELEQWVR